MSQVPLVTYNKDKKELQILREGIDEINPQVHGLSK